MAKGGAERSVAMLSQMLSSGGHQVHVVVLNNEIDFKYSGTLFSLGALKPKKDHFIAIAMKLFFLFSFFRFRNEKDTLKAMNT